MDGITFYGRYFNVITMNTQSQKVSMAEKIGYSLGDCSANLVFQMMMIYQTKFYTDIFGLEGAIAGTVMLVARITDAFVDPTVGLLSDRTKTRFGKYRPWVLWTALPFMVFYVLAFYNPGIEDKGLVALYATLSYTLLMSLYSFNNTPYASLGGVMSGDIKERTSITSIRFVAATIAQFVVQGLTLPLVSKFSDGGDKAHGWLCTISLFACIGFVFLVITFFSTRASTLTVIRGWKLEFRLPLGPLTATVCAASSTVTVTPAGMTMGFLPILDIVFYPFLTTRRPGLRRRRVQHVQPYQS